MFKGKLELEALKVYKQEFCIHNEKKKKKTLSNMQIG